jgi:release factor glutamine methyltransferase
LSDLAARLAGAGFPSADEEALELETAAGGDTERLEAMVRRRERGEPLAWITGALDFGGVRVTVTPGVYVPRLQTVPLAQRAVQLLPSGGTVVDLCCGSGVVGAFVLAQRSDVRVLATDTDEAAVACARANGVDAHAGDLFAPLPLDVRGTVDVVTAVAPYVPTRELAFLPRDVQAYEPASALDGGSDGLDLVRRIVHDASGWLAPGGVLLLEIGGDQAVVLAPLLATAGYVEADALVDEEGDVRGISGRRP